VFLSGPVHVITLRRTPERREAFARRNAHLHYVEVEGVDGRSLTEADIAASGLFEPGLRYSSGSFGCAMSHLRLWDQAIAANRPITVAEDDAIFRLDFHAQQERLLAQAPPDWDLLVWSWNFDAPMSLFALPGVSPMVVLCQQERMRQSTEAFQSLDAPAALVRLDKWWGLPAYTISPRGARRFKRMCVPLRNFEFDFPLAGRPARNAGIDGPVTAVAPLTLTYGSIPPLAVTPNRPETSGTQEKQWSLRGSMTPASTVWKFRFPQGTVSRSPAG
jgi:glycosyl transferase, family 25